MPPPRPDYEDANTPSWRNQIEGQLNLIDAVQGTISYDGSDGRHYELGEAPATVTAEQLLDVTATPGEITEAGLRNDISVAFQYISFWLGGRGAVAISNMMEDAATAEICRAQLWQWIRHGMVTRERVREILDEEMQAIRDRVGDDLWHAGNPDRTRAIFERVALADDLPEFLTVPAYDYID